MTATTVGALLLAAATLTPTPAASFVGGSITHHAPDQGYDPPIQVLCDGDYQHTIPEGTSSDDPGVCRDQDVDMVWVGYDQQIACRTIFGTWTVRWDRNGWHAVGDYSDRTCVMQRD